MEKHPEKKDRRIKKTQKSIHDAIISLLQEKDISEITIKELAERANINRKTFYMHYSSIEDIFDKIENEITEKLLRVLNKYDFSSEKFDGYAFFSSLNDMISEDLDLHQKLIRANSYHFLLAKIKKIFKDSLIKIFQKEFNANKEEFSLYAEFTASGLVCMYIEWFNMNSNITLEDLAKTASNITLNGINSITMN